MNKVMHNIRESFSLRLSLSILGFAVAVFTVSMGFLFLQSRKAIRKGAIEKAAQVLDNNTLRIVSILEEVEVATHNTGWLAVRNLQADSLFAYTRRILELNPNLHSCSISLEPYTLEAYGKYFSAFSAVEDGHIETVLEGSDEYNYFEMDWHKEAITLQKPVWLDPFYDFNSQKLEHDMFMISSYCLPLVTDDGRHIGVISTDISKKLLDQVLSDRRLYPNSFRMIIGKKNEVIASNNADATLDDLNRRDCIVLRQAIPHTEWSVAIVCPESDIFKGHNRLAYFVFTTIILGLLLMVLVCYIIVHRNIAPLSLLAKQTETLAEGNFDVRLPLTPRQDTIGQLQNSFSKMQESIAAHIAHLRQVKEETERHSEELKVAKTLAVEADRNKTAFIQDISHQIRTPLNIIGGFAQVMRDSLPYLSQDDINELTEAMMQNSHVITTIISHLMTSSELEAQQAITCDDMVNCMEACRLAARSVRVRNPRTVHLSVSSALPEYLQIRTNRESLLKILSELVNNANRFTEKGQITISYEKGEGQTIVFSVTDTGPGIPAAEAERIFARFTKIDSFTEGLGLGLMLSRQLARQMGGDLTLDTTYTAGARFLLTLPRT